MTRGAVLSTKRRARLGRGLRHRVPARERPPDRPVLPARARAELHGGLRARARGEARADTFIFYILGNFFRSLYLLIRIVNSGLLE